jgi:ribosomal protein S18 acetylase RimI-like enzyme
MKLRTRPAAVRDATQLTALALQVWLDTYAREGMREEIARYVLEAFTPGHFERLIADPDRHVLVAEQHAHLLGYCVLAENTACPVSGHEYYAELATLYVVRHFHGQGVGSMLLQASDHLAADLGAAGLWLNTWHGNTEARGFYRQRGFEDVGSCWFDMNGERHENRVFVRPLHTPLAT